MPDQANTAAGDDPATPSDDAVFLRDLAGRLFRIPAALGVDQGDTDALHDIAQRLAVPASLPCKSGEGAEIDLCARVREFKSSWLESNGAHWGDAIDWNTAAEIAFRLSKTITPSKQFAKSSPDAEMPAGMKPWLGGDSAPKDWDGGPVLARSGRMMPNVASWTHPWRKAWPTGRVVGENETDSDVVAYTPSSPDAAGSGGEAREGCVGTMDANRAIYFLERFKREEKLLGPHEQWALDFTIAALRPDATQTREAEGMLHGDESRADKLSQEIATKAVDGDPQRNGSMYAAAYYGARHALAAWREA